MILYTVEVVVMALKKDKMSYKVFGTARMNGCKGGQITHLLVKKEYESKVYSLNEVVDMIEAGKASFWSYHYSEGKIDNVNKMIVEVVSMEDKKLLMTCSENRQKNNLFELPIYYLNDDKQTWRPCLAESP